MAAVTPVGIGYFYCSRVEIVLTVMPAVKAFCDVAAMTLIAADNK